MKTYFTIDISNKENHSSLSTAETTLVDAFASAIRNASYNAIECGYSPLITIKEVCDECHGDGKVAKRSGKTTRSRLRNVRCPECRGKDSQRTIVENVPFELHSNCGPEYHGRLSDYGLAAIHSN